jgi:deoxyribonuclease-2
VLGANATGGFLLSHTLPKFPVLTAAYRYVGSVLYAQTYLCISLDPAGVEAAAAGAMHVDPHVYASLVPSGALTTLYPTVTALVAGARTSGSAAVALRSTAGNMFTYYVKSGDFGKDLWEDVVQAALQVNMWVETWRRPPVMDTYCAPPYSYDSINVDTMRYLDADGAEVVFRYTQDHSKLAVAVNATAQTQWICVADNNRMTSQWARGGGALCWRFAPLFNALVSAVVLVDGCPAA